MRAVLKQGVPLLLIVLMLLIAGCAAPEEAPPTVGEGEIKRLINVEADGLILHYSYHSFWGEAKFSEYLANQTEFKTNFKEDFEQELAQSGASASDYSFSFDSVTQSTIVRCDIQNAISLRSEGRYYARFEWLLNPLGLDFIDNNFEKSRTELSWEGYVNNMSVSITLRFPKPINHCHAHVWWSD